MQEPDYLGKLLAQKSRYRKHLTPTVLQQAIEGELPKNHERVKSVHGGYTLRTRIGPRIP